MSHLELILAVCTFVLLLITVLLIIGRYRQNAKLSKLADRINDFAENGSLLDFSIKDGELARLQNGIFDLENMVNLEKSNTLEQIKKNMEFISDISHQLKTPIAALRLYCEIDNAETPNEHTKKEIQLIEKMESLIQNLLKLEKLKSDTYIMNIHTHEVSDIVNGTLSSFRQLFPGKKYVVSGNSLFRCDDVWLSEAIGNLVKNASEHTAEDGMIKINITNGQKSTIIEIQDNGGGVDETEMPNLFTRFYKTKNASPYGAGIGLAITKAIVEKHHGIISAENKNNGLCVTMCLPHVDGIQSI